MNIFALSPYLVMVSYRSVSTDIKRYLQGTSTAQMLLAQCCFSPVKTMVLSFNLLVFCLFSATFWQYLFNIQGHDCNQDSKGLLCMDCVGVSKLICYFCTLSRLNILHFTQQRDVNTKQDLTAATGSWLCLDVMSCVLSIMLLDFNLQWSA